MILVSVRDHKSLYPVHVFLQISNIRNYQIDSQHVVVREGKTAVYHNNTVLVLKRSNVHSDLLQTSQGDDLYFAVLIVFVCVLQVLPPLRSALFFCTRCKGHTALPHGP